MPSDDAIAALRMDAPAVVRRFSTPDGRVQVTLRGPAWINGSWWTCLERVLGPGQGIIAPHRHDHTDEIHIVKKGSVRFLQGFRVRTAHAGEAIRFASGGFHMDPWAMGEPATVLTYLGPASAQWLELGIRLGEMTEKGHLTSRGQPPLDSFMRAVHESGADVWAAGLPTVLQRTITTPTIAAVARLRSGRLA
jgi:hypothetical protein